MRRRIALKPLLEETGGNILVIGTPAEEAAGGKVYMAARGAFDGLDCAMMVPGQSQHSRRFRPRLPGARR